MLLFLVPSIISVFADQKDAINIQVRTTLAERLRDTRVNRDPVSGCHRSAHIPLGDLVHIHRNDVDLRLHPAIVRRKALEKLRHDDVRVRIPSILCYDSRNSRFQIIPLSPEQASFHTLHFALLNPFHTHGQCLRWILHHHPIDFLI